MDDVLCQFSKAQADHIHKVPGIQFPQSQYGFFRNLNPMKNAIESAQYFLQHPQFDPYILTSEFQVFH